MDLFKKLDNFYHLAVFGKLLLPPPVMTEKIKNFVVGALATYSLRILDGKNFQFEGEVAQKMQRELDNIKTIFHIYADRMGGVNPIDIGTSFHDLVPFDFTGWHNPFGDPYAVKQIMDSEGIPGVTVEVYFVKELGNAKAHWYGESWTIKIYIALPPLEDILDFKMAAMKFDQAATNVKTTVEHELIHMVQQIGNYVKNLRGNQTGLPPANVRHRDYDPYGFQREDTERGGTKREHSLHDIEFYTNLHDAINEYKSLTAHLPANSHDEFFRIFTGSERVGDVKKYPLKLRDKLNPNAFFATLQSYDPKRWQLAVKRMVSYLRG